MSEEQLEELAEDIRAFLIESISRTGGHLSSNLGIVELTLALHKVFDSPKDKIIFDVGHQCYVHKILTGRAKQFHTLRQYQGLSGFQKREESEHDFWEAGHSSTSLSAALGMAIARDLKKEDYEIIPVIGDGALTGGMALEALNDIGSKQKKVIIVFNDNNMSISRNHSAMEKRITTLRTSPFYRTLKKDVKRNLDNKVGAGVLTSLSHMKDTIKSEIIDAPLFKEFNLDYIGPIDGHNIPSLVAAFTMAKEVDGPIVVHVTTTKGKGYKYAQEDKMGAWHGVAPFNIETGQSLFRLPKNELTWSAIISNTLIDLAAKNPDIVAITPAMATGSKLIEFSNLYPDRFFDAQIAEQHAMTMAAGMAQAGLQPFIYVYSSFLQRAYDQLSHDVARMNLPVVIGVDRAGLVGDDGDTHQGIYDIAFMRSIPNLIIAQPKDAKEAQNLLYTAFKLKKPFALRYPKGNIPYKKNEEYELIEPGTWTYTDVLEPKQIVISYGPDVDRIIKKAKENQVGLRVVNARYIKPLDKNMLRELFESGLPITVFETDISNGGLSSAILEEMNASNENEHIDVIGIHDKFVPHGSIRKLRELEGINIEALFEELEYNEHTS
jgi:1-deoxy-D-xylulose-5-phosphate synthase